MLAQGPPGGPPPGPPPNGGPPPGPPPNGPRPDGPPPNGPPPDGAPPSTTTSEYINNSIILAKNVYANRMIHISSFLLIF